MFSVKISEKHIPVAMLCPENIEDYRHVIIVSQIIKQKHDDLGGCMAVY